MFIYHVTFELDGYLSRLSRDIACDTDDIEQAMQLALGFSDEKVTPDHYIVKIERGSKLDAVLNVADLVA